MQSVSRVLNKGDLIDILNSKADFKYVDGLARSKVPLDDWYSLLASIQHIYGKLKHVSVVQADLAAKLIPSNFKNLKTLHDASEVG